LEHPLLGAAEGDTLGPGSKQVHGVQAPAGLIVVTSDTGLCGTYNEKVLAAAELFLKENPSAVVVTIGKKGSRRLARLKVSRAREILDWGGRYEPAKAGELLVWLEERFLRKEVSGWSVAYTQFTSALSWRPVVKGLLPLDNSGTDANLKSIPGTTYPVPKRVPNRDSDHLPEKVIVEPDVPRFAEALLRESVRTRFGRALLEGFTSEHSARMMAMKNATENASDMISSLTLVRNKVRQAAITKELIEVVGGAQALQ
jgi:F-type H+-transporting ATPase subunit gamma